jgi:2-oxoacid:acceptor oxidoreductase delta subunit (pyruvate/2-ketoisovalerate family)
MERPFAITLQVGSSHANHTGSWRVERPVYVANQPPCSAACPVGEDIQGWLYHAESGDYAAAWRLIVETNPFPAIMGRICYHPCESSCNRVQVDEAVGINAVERFLGDYAIDQGLALPPAAPDSGHRVLVVGSGPAGLSAAYHLRRSGQAVRLVDSSPLLGGMMRYGIPAYRLPRAVLDAEIERVIALGVEVECNHKVTDVVAEQAAGGYDAVFLAVGAQLARRVEIPAGDSARVVDAVAVLRAVADSTPPLLGRRVVVYGGGNTALDTARTAKRLGATDAVVVYRRTKEQMPAHGDELTEAVTEGITMRWLSTVNRVDEDTIVIEKMELDESGFPQPTGEFETLGADALVLALGQDTDLSLLDAAAGVSVNRGMVEVSPALMTDTPGIFAGGDATDSPRTATVAIAHGSRAAAGIQAYLNGEAPPVDEPRVLATFKRLNTWYYADAPRLHRAELAQVRRQGTFDEVVSGLIADNALFEARRCLSCGNCFGCDNCFGVCPDNAVMKIADGKYEFNYDFCKGCGICVTECPCGAIEMIPERT